MRYSESDHLRSIGMEPLIFCGECCLAQGDPWKHKIYIRTTTLNFTSSNPWKLVHFHTKSLIINIIKLVIVSSSDQASFPSIIASF